MKRKPLIISSVAILVVFVLILLLTSSYLNWKNNYQKKIYPGVSAGDIDLSGKSYEEAQIILNSRTQEIIKAGLDFNYNNKKINIALVSESLSPEAYYQLVNYNIDDTLEKAFAYNKSGSFFDYLISQIKSKKQNNISGLYDLDEEKIIYLLAESYKELDIQPENASFSLSKEQILEINPEKIGKEINYELVLSEIKNNLNNFQKTSLNLTTHSKYPEVKSGDLKSIEDEAKKLIGQSGIKLTYVKEGSNTNNLFWTIKSNKLISWLSVVKKDKNLILVLDQEKIKEYLTINVSPETDIASIRPKFEINNGKVSSWQSGISGQKLNTTKSAEKISNEFFAGQKEISLIVEEELSEKIDSEDTYNIKEIIGTGQSNFVGSPTNRRKNIQVGANAVNGILLAPNEEFSLVKALGEVSKESGYFPELVIKDNRTVPEFGGGLCQVATTLFRSALASGLPITARRNHSYRVSYYEPAGTDAAVYIPNPDVRFVNDTGNYILIQSRIVKDDIYFDFWGARDGRIATTTKPVVYNIVKPAPTKFVESSELAPGQKKCTEHAHNGADAYFDYKVIYPAGVTTTPVVERRFSSHYVPWQEVCLIGRVAATSTASSTNSLPSNLISTSTSATTTTTAI